MQNEASKKEIQEKSFKSALLGIKTGTMKYENDPVLPMLQAEMKTRIDHFKGLSKEEEGKLLSLSPEQKKVITENDKK